MAPDRRRPIELFGPLLLMLSMGRAALQPPVKNQQTQEMYLFHSHLLRRRGALNTDQGSQFTSVAFTGLLSSNGIAISMDSKGSWRDNVFVERLWRSIKYEEIYLRAYASVSEARASIGRYIDFYNGRRPHSSLDRQTPDQAYFSNVPRSVAA